MLKVLKADFYRLFKTSMFWATFVFCGASIIISLALQIIAKLKGTAVTVEKCKSIFELYSILLSGVIIFFGGLTLIYFCGRERKNGFKKNITGIVDRREYCVFSKMIITVFISAVYTILFWVTDIIIFLIEGNRLEGVKALTLQSRVSEVVNGVLYNPGDVVVTRGELILRWMALYGTAFMITLSMMMLFLLIMELTGITSLGYVVGIMLVSGLIDQIISGAFLALKNLFGIFEDFDITEYLLMMNLNGLDRYSEPDEVHFLRYVVIALIYIVVFGGLSVFISKRRDDSR